MSGSFVALHRSDSTLALLKRHNKAFILLTQIALRARWRDACPVYGLEPGEAMIGDFQSIGLTESEYRTAKKQLSRYGFVTFRVTPKGTIARLTSSTIYSISEKDDDGHIDRQVTDALTGKSQASDGQVTTNYKDTRKQGYNDKPKPPFPEYSEFESYLLAQLPEQNPEWTPERIRRASKLQYETFVENGWRDGHGKPVKNWKTKAKNVMSYKKPYNFGNEKPQTSTGSCI